jgi:hypothetical protein
MFSKNYINNIIVANGTARTGTQVWNPTGSGYIVPSEVVVTTPAGVIWDGTVAVPDEIMLQFRHGAGSKVQTKVIHKNDVKSYFLREYAAPTNKVVTVGITGTYVVGATYMLKFRIIGYGCSHFAGMPLAKTVAVVATTGTSATNLATDFVTKINADFAGDPMWKIVASSSGAGLILTAQPLVATPGKFEYSQLDFIVEPVNFTGTSVVTNALSPGTGHYAKVAQMEYEGRQDYGVVPLVTQHIPATPITLNAQANCEYNVVTINWEKEQGTFSKDTLLKGTITVYCDTTTEQGPLVYAALEAFLTDTPIV